MKRFYRMVWGLLLGTGLVLGGFSIASGQEDGEKTVEDEKTAVQEDKTAAKDYTLEETVVTVSKREQELIEVPQSVTAFSGDYLEAAGVRNYNDLVLQLPNAFTGSSEIQNTNQGVNVYLRGTGIAANTKQMSNSTTSYYVDETAFGFPNVQFGPPMNAMFDLERIEVIYGPSGSVYGQGAMGGTIKIITKEVDLQNFDGKAMVEGSHTRDADGINYSVNAMFNAPVVEDKLGLRLIAGQERVASLGTIYDDPNADDPNGSDTTSVRIKGLWKPVDTLSLGAYYWHMEFEQNILFGYWRDVDNLIIAPVDGRIPNNDNDFDLGAVTLKWDLPFAELVSNTSLISGGKSEDTAFYYPAEWNDGVDAVLHFDSVWATEGWSHETRLVSNQDNPFKWLGGIFYSDGESKYDSFSYLSDPPTSVVMSTEAQHGAVFGEASYDFFDAKLIPLLGLRYWQEDRIGLDESGIGAFSQERNLDGFNPRFNIVYYPSFDSMFYFNAAKGSRGGIMNLGQGAEDLINSGYEGDPYIMDSDYMWSYELGSKWSFFNDKLIAMGALYYTQWYEVQQPVDTIIGTIGAFANVGDIDIRGLEWNFLWRPLASLGFTWAGSYNYSEWVEITPGPWRQAYKVGDKVEGTPDWTTNISADFNTPVGSYFDFFARIQYSWKQKVSSFPFWDEDDRSLYHYPVEAAAEDTDLSFQTGIIRGRWSVWLFGRNVLDQDQPTNGGTKYDHNERLYTSYGGWIPRPRTIGLTLSYDYGAGSTVAKSAATRAGGSVAK